MASKRTREQIEADRQALEEELAALGVDAEIEEDDDDSEILVIHGKKGIAKLLKHLNYEDAEEEEEEEEKPKPKSKKKAEPEEEEESEEEEDEGEEEESEEEEEELPKKKTTSKPKVVKDATPKPRSRWFGDR